MKHQIPDSLSTVEALEDIEMLEYLISTSYSGFEYWQYKGVNFQSYFEHLKAFVSNTEYVRTTDFENEVARILDQFYDGHISFIGSGYHQAYRHKSVFFSDILVEQTDQGLYRVIDSKNEKIEAGALFTQEDKESYLFQTLSPPDKKHYFIGVFSFGTVNSHKFEFDLQEIAIPLHKSRLMFARFDDPKPFYIDRLNKISVLRITSFADALYPQMQEFMEAGKILRDEETIIVNLFNNGGGSSVFPQTFIRNLNGSVQWETHWAELTSPAITAYYAAYDLDDEPDVSPALRDLVARYSRKAVDYKRTPHKSWDFSRTDKRKILGEYRGKLILLTNRRVLSAGENMVGSSRSVPDQITIGENTGGSAQFSSTCDYFLPHSKLILILPRQLIFIPGLEECVGYLPDYWLDTNDPVGEVLSWLSDPQGYQFRYRNSYGEMLETLEISAVLPHDTQVVPPSEAIPASLARYSGKWFGVSDGILDHLLVVENIRSRHEVDAIYAWGVAYQWGINEPGWERFKGAFRNGKLVLEAADWKQTITYEITQDGSMDSYYQRPGIHSYTELVKLED